MATKKRTPRPTRGSEAFDAYCAKQANRTEFMAALAAEYGVEKQTLYRWRDGTNQPPVERMVAMQRDLGIPMEFWGERVERREPKAA